MKTKERFASLRGSFHADPSMLGRSLEARGLYACGLSYCAAWMTDGKIPKAIVNSWFRSTPDCHALCHAEHNAYVINELLVKLPHERRPMWSEDDEFYWVIAYTEHNWTRKRIEDERRKTAERQAKHRRRSGDDNE